MVRFTISTYFNEKLSLDKIKPKISKNIANELALPSNNGLWKLFLDKVWDSVREEDREGMRSALLKTDRKNLHKYIYADMGEVKYRGYLSIEEDRAQTTLRYETPFLFDEDSFWKDCRAYKEKPDTKKFTFGVVFQSYGRKTVNIPASIKTWKEAQEWVREHWNKISLPNDAEYVIGSYEPDFEECELYSSEE